MHGDSSYLEIRCCSSSSTWPMTSLFDLSKIIYWLSWSLIIQLPCECEGENNCVSTAFSWYSVLSFRDTCQDTLTVHNVVTPTVYTGAFYTIWWQFIHSDSLSVVLVVSWYSYFFYSSLWQTRSKLSIFHS